MSYIRVRGAVVGGHRLKDLGITVPYGEEVRLPKDRAAWSRDLSEALNARLVEKVGEISSSAPSKRAILAGTKDPKPRATVQVVRAPKSVAEAPTSEDIVNKLSKVVSEQSEILKAQTKMIDTLSEMVKDQTSKGSLSMADMEALLSRLTQAQGAVASLPQVVQPAASNDEDDVMFIPSKIRRDDVKVSTDLDVKETTSKKSGVEDASKALAQLKKSKKGK